MTAFTFHRLAVKDFLVAFRWYRHRNPQAADRFSAAVDVAVARILRDPEAFAVIESSVRYVRVRRYPYYIVYWMDSQGEIEVPAVAHESRRQGYWKRRKR